MQFSAPNALRNLRPNFNWQRPAQAQQATQIRNPVQSSNPHSQSQVRSLVQRPDYQLGGKDSRNQLGQDDSMSVISETTLLNTQGEACEISQILRGEFSELAKTFVECNARNTQTLVEAICTSNKKEGRLDEVQAQVEETMKLESAVTKDAIIALQDKVLTKLQSLQADLVEALTRLTLNPQQKKKRHPIKRKYADFELNAPIRKLPSLPCECLLNQGGRLTRMQRIEAWMQGKLKCNC